jgi:hypothetical protein
LTHAKESVWPSGPVTVLRDAVHCLDKVFHECQHPRLHPTDRTWHPKAQRCNCSQSHH